MNIDTIKQRAKAFDYLFDAVVVTDLQGIITDWNKGSESLYGYSKEEAIGQPVNILHVPEDTESITSTVIQAVQEFGKWSGEIRMLHKNGNIGWVESMCVPIFDDENQMIGALGINRDITTRVKEAEHLHHQAHYDQLTKLPNRYLLLDRINHLISQSERTKGIFALFYVDLDKFKLINDTKGHAFGDLVLVEAASRLEHSVRKSDTVARVGGDEFVVLLENISNRNKISEMAESIVNALNESFIINTESMNSENIKMSCSIGIAIYPEDGSTMDKLLAAADVAMYKAKDKGRSTFEY